MTPRTRKGKCPRRRKATKARKPRGKATARPKAPKRPSGPLSVSREPLGGVRSIYVSRGDATYVHHFTGRGLPTLHTVEGSPGVLVLRGRFHVDASGMIHDD